MICKNCGGHISEYVSPTRDYSAAGSKLFVHTKTNRDLCHGATFAEPAAPTAEKMEDVVLTRVINLASSGFMAQAQSTTSLVYAISDLAKMVVRLVQKDGLEFELLAAQEKIKELEQWCRDLGREQMALAARAVR